MADNKIPGLDINDGVLPVDSPRLIRSIIECLANQKIVIDSQTTINEIVRERLDKAEARLAELEAAHDYEH